VKYIMVTDWRNHWDMLPKGLASFTMNMLVPPMDISRLKDGTRATLLLFSRDPRSPVKAWTGKVTDIGYNRELKKIGFRVKLTREIRFPRRYAGLDDGWYVEEPPAEASAHGLW